MNESTKEMVQVVEENIPNIWKTTYPRRIVPPRGFANPKYYSASLSASALMWAESNMNLLPHVTCSLTSILQSMMTVPTYFVREEFAQAVANTKLPMDFKLSELRWPLDAMLFVLPDSFVRSYFGFYTPFISICKCAAGNYPNIDQCRYIDKNEWELKRCNPVFNEVDRMLLHFPCYPTNTLPFDYSGSWPLKLDLSTIQAADFVDATIYERAIHGVDMPEMVGAPNPEQEKALQDKLTVFAIKLMLAFTARPQVIKKGDVARTAKFKNGKQIRDELWNPNLVGWYYVIKRSGQGPGTGTHASPRMSWRPGHFTHQFIGKRGDPNFVSATALPRKETDGSIDWDKLDPAVQEAFWKSHKLMWLDPVLYGGNET